MNDSPFRSVQSFLLWMESYIKKDLKITINSSGAGSIFSENEVYLQFSSPEDLYNNMFYIYKKMSSKDKHADKP